MLISTLSSLELIGVTLGYINTENITAFLPWISKYAIGYLRDKTEERYLQEDKKWVTACVQRICSNSVV